MFSLNSFKTDFNSLYSTSSDYYSDIRCPIENSIYLPQEEFNQDLMLMENNSKLNINNMVTNNQTTNNLELNNLELKTASSDTDYPNLFRGLSSIDFTSLNSIIETKHDPGNLDSENTNNLSSEKTYADLSDLVLQVQQQAQHTQPKMSVTDSLTSGEESLDTNNSLCSVEYSKQTVSLGTVLSTLKNFEPKEVKRLSAATSMASTSGLIDTSKKPKRGRKPSSMYDDPTTKLKLTKKQKIEQELNKPVVCFGNKVVEKDTDEYKKRRESNNVAVKKCREKLNEKQKEREERMNLLTEENKKLNSTVETLNKELNVLKNIIIQMTPEKKLPDHIQLMFKNLDNQ